MLSAAECGQSHHKRQEEHPGLLVPQTFGHTAHQEGNPGVAHTAGALGEAPKEDAGHEQEGDDAPIGPTLDPNVVEIESEIAKGIGFFFLVKFSI